MCVIKDKWFVLTYSETLTEDTGLFELARPTELLHVSAEVAVAALRPQAGFAAFTAHASSPQHRHVGSWFHWTGNDWRGRQLWTHNRRRGRRRLIPGRLLGRQTRRDLAEF